MELPIPDDWTNADWLCVQVQWPNSPQWIALLQGFLTYATRGRVWDETTGSIQDVQAIGREIHDRNIPLVDCTGDQVNGNGAGDIAGFAGEMDELELEDCAMSCSIPYGSLRWFEGKLQYKYCGEWFDVAGDGPTFGGSGGGDITIPDPPPGNLTDSTACAIARKIAYFVADVIDAAWIELGTVDVVDIYDFVSDMRDKFPGIDLAYDDLINAYGYFAAVDVGGFENESKNPEIKEWLKCTFAPLITATNDGIDADTYNNLVDVTKTAVSNVYDSHDFEGFGGAIQSIWYYIMKSIGSGDAKDLTRWVQPLPEDDCDCPGETSQQTQETESGWYFSEVRTIRLGAPGGFNDAVAVFYEQLPEDAFGIAWQGVYVSGFPLLRVKPSNDATPQAGYDHWWFGSNSNSDGPDGWQVQCGPSAWTEINAASLLPDMTHYQQFLWSDTPATPGADDGELSLAKINARADGGDNDYCVCDINIRYLYNSNSPSHS